MVIPVRGASTAYDRLHLTYTGLLGDDIGGSPITSYNVQWDNGNNGASYTDIVGASTDYL